MITVELSETPSRTYDDERGLPNLISGEGASGWGSTEGGGIGAVFEPEAICESGIFTLEPARESSST